MKKNLFFSIWLLLSLCMAAVSFSSCEKEDDKNGTSTENDKDKDDNKPSGVTISILFDKDGSFVLGEEVTGSITSAEEDLQKVIVMKANGEVVETITTFEVLPIMKKNNDGEYMVSIGGLTEGRYLLKATSKTGVNTANFELVKSGSGENTDDDNSSSGESVLINGVRWATRNVDEFGTFAASPESPGMFYQWNRKKAWPATGSVTGWDSSNPTGTEWEEANDPSPAGYRVPTFDEIKTLFDEDVTNEWTIKNGVEGRKFTDKNNGNSIFLPAVGYRNHNYGSLDYDGTDGHYWSSTASENNSYGTYYLYFFSSNAGWFNYYRNDGFSVRPVAE
jgi:uncharacterized protein (TIGR02145 family)